MKILTLIKSGSHVINIDSNYGAQSFPIDDKTHVGYRLAKAALNMYTRILDFYLKDKNIKVSSLDPGWVKTDMGMVAATGINHPDKEPEEVAEEIYRIAAKVNESGYFWHFGQKREW
jgi:NAD(P)-dependent dehydrogenase (short-subunit alcohol dehydrogenase family)